MKIVVVPPSSPPPEYQLTLTEYELRTLSNLVAAAAYEPGEPQRRLFTKEEKKIGRAFRDQSSNILIKGEG